MPFKNSLSREFRLALLHFCSQSFDLTKSALAGAAVDSLREDQGSGGTGLRRPEILSKTILTSTLRIHDDPDTARLVMPSPGSAAENEPTMHRTHTTHSQRPNNMHILWPNTHTPVARHNDDPPWTLLGTFSRAR